MPKKKSAQSKPVKPRTMVLESGYPADYVPRTMRQAIAELNEFREEWRRRYQKREQS